MKQKILELIAFILFITSILYIWGTAGAVDLNNITIGQAAIQMVPGIIILGGDTVLINYITRKEEEF